MLLVNAVAERGEGLRSTQTIHPRLLQLAERAHGEIILGSELM